MKQFDFYDCIRKKLLRTIPQSKEKAEGSIKTAQKWINESEKNLNSKALNSSVISSYLAMFHAARAILFYDGFREKSHYCVARYLEEKYAKKNLLENKWIELLDYYRELRHDGQYSISFFATKEEAKRAFEKSKEFIERMSRLLNNMKNNLENEKTILKNSSNL